MVGRFLSHCPLPFNFCDSEAAGSFIRSGYLAFNILIVAESSRETLYLEIVSVAPTLCSIIISAGFVVSYASIGSKNANEKWHCGRTHTGLL
jgi:hypothetical protein